MEKLEVLEKELELTQLKLNSIITQSELIMLFNNEFQKMHKLRIQIEELKKGQPKEGE